MNSSKTTQLINLLTEAQKYAMSIRPKVGGFPVLAEALSQAGIKLNRWTLPSCQSVYIIEHESKLGAVVQQGSPLVSGAYVIPQFNKEALIKAIRTDQEGQSTFPEFLVATWNAGVVSYDADFVERKVTYFGALGESYVESYPAVDLNKL